MEDFIVIFPSLKSDWRQLTRDVVVMIPLALKVFNQQKYYTPEELLYAASCCILKRVCQSNKILRIRSEDSATANQEITKCDEFDGKKRNVPGKSRRFCSLAF